MNAQTLSAREADLLRRLAAAERERDFFQLDGDQEGAHEAELRALDLRDELAALRKNV